MDGETEKSVLGDAYFTEDDLTRANDDAVGDTGNGVLTQVYQDIDNHEITIAVINTYLAKAQEDYDEKNEEVDLTIYELDNKGSSRTPVFVKMDDSKEDYTVESDEFDIADVAENDLFRVTVADGAVQSMVAPEILSDTTIANFRLEKYVTADGTQYDYSKKGGIHNANELADYNVSALDNTYKIFLDAYGYVIGTEKVSGELKYLFLTGYDRPETHLGIKTAEAAAIFLDGTMTNIEVNVSKSNANITGVAGYDEFDAQAGAWMSRYNRWFTYTTDSDGVYTLTPVDNWVNTPYDADRDVINSASVRLDGVGYNTLGVGGADDGKDVAYGNDDSIYITVKLGRNDYDSSIIDEVNNVYTGVQNVDMKISKDNSTNPVTDSVFTVYDDDRYVIGSIVIGDDVNNNKNYAYGIDTDAMNEYVLGDDDYVYWDFDAIVAGEPKTLTVKAEYGTVFNELQKVIVGAVGVGEGAMLELTYDKEGYVVDALVLTDGMTYDNSAEDFIYGNDEYKDKTVFTDDYGIYLVDVGVNNSDIVGTATLSTNGKTLWLTGDDYGLTIAEGAPVIVVQNVEDGNGNVLETEVDSYINFNSALKALAQENTFRGQIAAVLNDKGTAEYVVLNSDIADGAVVDDGTVGGNADGLVNLEYKDSPANGGWGIKVTTKAAVAKDTTYKVTLYMINGGTKVDLDTYDVVVKAGFNYGFLKVDGLVNGQQYQLVCGDVKVLVTP